MKDLTLADIAATLDRFKAEVMADPLPVRFETADVGAFVRALDAAGIRPRKGGETYYGFASMQGMPIVPNDAWPHGAVMAVYADGLATQVCQLPLRSEH